MKGQSRSALPGRGTLTARAVYVAVLVLLVCVLGLIFLRSAGVEAESRPIRELVRQTLGATLPVQARFVGGFSCPQESSDSNTAAMAAELVRLRPAIRTRLSDLLPVQRSAEDGFISVLEYSAFGGAVGRRSLDRAVDQFRAASRAPTHSAELLNDLAQP